MQTALTLSFSPSYAMSPKIKFCSVDTPTFDLLDNSIGTASINGTVGIESICRSKRTMIFSPTWYQKFHGVDLIKSQEDITFSIDKMMTAQPFHTPTCFPMNFNPDVLFSYNNYIACDFEDSLLSDIASKFILAYQLHLSLPQSMVNLNSMKAVILAGSLGTRVV